jgi:hypothetical protein
MRHIRLMIVLAFLFVSCGGGDDGVGPGDSGNDNTLDPVPTAAGTPDGVPVTGTIGAGGGSLASSDGLLTINVPAGALSADTDITIQPLENTAWGGVGAGYRLTPDGLTFSTLIDLVFEVTPEALAGSAADFLDVAVQDDQGFWYILRNRTYDDGMQTLTGQTSHFTDYSMIDGLQIRPPSANVNPSGTVTLDVKACFQKTYGGGDDELTALLITCDDDLAPLVILTDWSVNAVKGGNSTIGRVTSTDPISARYTAPTTAPAPNTVAVSVKATYQNSSALLVCNITIGTQWAGTATHYYSQGTGDPSDVETAVFTLTWADLGTFGNEQYLTPTGSVTYTVWPWPGCPQVSFVPDTRLINSEQGLLTIDHSTDPPTFSWWAGTFWDAEYCSNCGDGIDCETITVSAGSEPVEGSVSADGNTISGHFVDSESGEGYDFEFTKVAGATTSRIER